MDAIPSRQSNRACLRKVRYEDLCGNLYSHSSPSCSGGSQPAMNRQVLSWCEYLLEFHPVPLSSATCSLGKPAPFGGSEMLLNSCSFPYNQLTMDPRFRNGWLCDSHDLARLRFRRWRLWRPASICRRMLSAAAQPFRTQRNLGPPAMYRPAAYPWQPPRPAKPGHHRCKPGVRQTAGRQLCLYRTRVQGAGVSPRPSAAHAPASGAAPPRLRVHGGCPRQICKSASQT